MAEGLHNGTLCHYVVCPPHSERPEGYLALYNAQLSDGYAYFAFQRLQPGRAGIMYEGVFQFFDYCFDAFNLRKIYIEVPGYNLPQFASVLDQLFEADAQIPERDFYADQFWTLTIAHLSRSRWASERGRWAKLLAPHPD